MATERITAHVRHAWWVRWYLAAHIVFARLHSLQPDGARLAAFIARRGVRITFSSGGRHGHQ